MDEGWIFPGKNTRNWTTDSELEAFALALMLHSGEVAALQVASEVPGSLLFTDDTAARLAAKQMGLPVHGTIGILLRAIRRKQKTGVEVVQILHACRNVRRFTSRSTC